MRNLPKDLAVVATALLLTGSLASVMQPPEHKDSVKATTKQIKTVSKATSIVVEAPKPPEPVLPTPVPVVAPAPSPAPVAPPPVARASGSCADWMAQAGVPNSHATQTLILKESGCNPMAVNRSSGACGIPQSLPCSKMGPVNYNGTSAVGPVQQLVWMQNYVFNRYGSWEAALNFHYRNNWY